MSKIHVMDEILSNKIAAGEVVESVMNVVKELVENSIDAKSTEISIRLKESGIKEIEVRDNGIGMDEADAKLAFSRHATSKIKDLDDFDEDLMFSPCEGSFNLERESVPVDNTDLLKNVPKKKGNFVEVPVMVNE